MAGGGGDRGGRVVLLVAGGTVALAAVGLSTARRARRGPGRARTGTPWLLGPLAALWLAGGIVDSITGALGGLVSRPIDWARQLVAGVVSWITDWVNHVIDWASRAFDAIDGVLDRLWDFGNSIVTWAAGQVRGVFDSLTSWVGRLVNDLRGWVSGWVNSVIDWAQRGLNALWDYGHSVVDWVQRNIWQPLWDGLQGALRWVQTSVVPWVAGIVGDLRSWAVAALDHVWQWVGQTLQPWLDWATTLLGVVQKAWGWLVWVAEHPLDWFQALWRQWTGLDSRQATASIVDALSRESDVVADHLVRWLG